MPKKETKFDNDYDMSGQKSSAFGVTLFSEAILLFLASGIAYIYSYKYETAYLSHFYISEQYVKLGIERMVGAALGLLTFAMLLFQLLDLLAKFEPGEKFRVLFLQFSIPIIFSTVAIWAYFETGMSGFTITLVAFAVAFWALTFLTPLLFLKKRASYFMAIAADVEAEEEVVNRGIVQRLRRKHNSNLPVVIFLIIFTGPALASLIGILDARSQRTFSVVVENSSWLVVRRNGDEFLLTEYNDIGNRLVPRVRLISAEKMGELVVVYKYLKAAPIRDSNLTQ